MIKYEEIPDNMSAILLTGHGGFDKLEYCETVPVPAITGDELLIRVQACGLNNTDVNTRVGWYSKSVRDATEGDGQIADDNEDGTWGGSALTFPHIQGADVCGIVVAAANESARPLLGKRVMIDPWFRNWDAPLDKEQCRYFGSESAGGYAQYTKAPAKNVHPINSNYSNAELASFPTSYMTAENMLVRANVKQEDAVLITGASGGVGSALIQLVKRRGAKTIALCGESKKDMVAALQPTAILPRNPENLPDALQQVIGCNRVDVVADIVGGDYWPQLIDVIVRGGTYTCAGAIAGPIVSFDLRTFYLGDLTFTGATITAPHIFSDLITYIEREEIKPLVAKIFPLKDFVQAQKMFLDKNHIGNIVVECGE